MSREEDLTQAFVELADTLVGDFDVADLLHRLVQHVADLLDVDAAGLLLNDHRGNLQLLASSTEATRLLELFQLQSDEGPCLDCFHTGRQVAVPDLQAVVDRWPRFVPAARECGYLAVHALPMRLREDTIGALNLFSASVGAMPPRDVQVAQALADVATVGILQERAARHREIIVEQTQAALNARVTIEQAKGLLASSGLGMEAAFESMRQYAESGGYRLADTARNLVEGRLRPSEVTSVSRTSKQ
ncbi:MAG: hypothetical protein QOI06_2491 [Nocardioidaceae bacterium]|nr:hypothetical protein [Nocardioidaceae bacterium]